jgi:hypothetical protein
MPVGLILEFNGQDQEQYDTIARHLRIDMATGVGDWPDGLLSHAAGATEAGWMVMEVWDSRPAHQRFMEDRLGAALRDAGVTGPPSRMEWLELTAYHTPRTPTG